MHWLLQEPYEVWLRWGIQELDFEGCLGFLFYPARQQVVEQGALADEEFPFSLEPVAAAAPPTKQHRADVPAVSVSYRAHGHKGIRDQKKI